MFEEAEDTSTYVVVVNHEEQYSIWPVERPLPLGWTELAVRGSKHDCLAHIKEVWTDMRPLSLRRAMEADTAPRKADAAPRKIESKKTEAKKTQLKKAMAQERKKTPRAAARTAGAKRAARRASGRTVAPKKTRRR